MLASYLSCIWYICDAMWYVVVAWCFVQLPMVCRMKRSDEMKSKSKYFDEAGYSMFDTLSLMVMNRGSW